MTQIKELAAFDKIAAGLADIQNQGNFIPDMTTKDGYEASKRFVLDVTTPTRTNLNAAHKEAKAYWLKGGKEVDAKKNEIMGVLLDIQKPHQDAYKAKDQEEKDRKARFEAGIQDKINELYNYRVLPPGTTSSDIPDIIQACGEADTQDGFYHLATEAFRVKNESLECLNNSLMALASAEAEALRQKEIAEQNRIQQEEIAKQQEAMRLQREEMERQQAEINRKNEEIAAEARKQAEAEQKIIDDQLRVEREAAEKIERERYAKEQSEIAAEKATQIERQRQYKERIAQEAEKARVEADKKHTGSVRKEIKEHIMSACGLDNETATKVVKALLKTNRVTINY